MVSDRRGSRPTGRARRRGRRGGRRRCARRPRRRARRRAASRARAGRPTAARRGRTAGASPRFTTTSLRGSSPRQPQATRFCQVSLPSQPLRSPSCQSPLRKTRSRERRRAAARRTRAGRRRAPRRAGGRGRPAGAPSAPRAAPRGRAARRSGSASSPPRRAPSPGGNVAAARGSSWFSMKRTSLLLVADVGRQVPVHRVGALVHEPVVEALVVAVVEALLLERVLEVPVGLGQEDEVGVRALDGARSRSASSRRPAARRPRSPQVRSKTSFIISIAMSQRTPSHCVGDRAERVDHRAAQVGRERVQLHDVGPGREVRVAAVREHAVADLHERGRVALEVVVAPADEVLGVRLRPRVVGRDVVRHEVEDQLQAALARAPRAPPRGPPARRGARRPCSRGCSTASRPRPRP